MDESAPEVPVEQDGFARDLNIELTERLGWDPQRYAHDLELPINTFLRSTMKALTIKVMNEMVDFEKDVYRAGLRLEIPPTE